MSRQYLREASLTISGRKFNTRIAFEIRKGEQSNIKGGTSAGVQSNKSTVSIYNLSEDSRGMIEREVGTGVMILEAGYKGSMATIFVGDIASVEMKRIGPDIETKIEAGDGELRLVDAHIELSLGPGATDSQIVEQAIKSLGLARGFISGVPATPRINGFAYSGPAATLLDKIASKNDLAWSVQGGAVQIRKEGDPAGRMAILLTDETGLLNIPNKTEDGFKVECLLNPDLEPGRLIQIESALLTEKATYEVQGVEHVGDTHGEAWKTTVWGAQL